MTKSRLIIYPCIWWTCIALIFFTSLPSLRAVSVRDNKLTPTWEFIVPVPNLSFNKASINQIKSDTAGNCAISVSYWTEIPATQFTPQVIVPTIGQIIYLDSKGSVIGILQTFEAYFSRILQLTSRGVSIATYTDGNIGGENFSLSMLFKPIASTPVVEDILVPSPSGDGTLIDPTETALRAIKKLVQEYVTLATKLPGATPPNEGVLLTELPTSTRWMHTSNKPSADVSGTNPVPGRVLRYSVGALTTIPRPQGR